MMIGSRAPLKNQPKFNTSTMVLLTDGRVMMQEEATPHWHALTPDAQGSYVNGASRQGADDSSDPLLFLKREVCADGRWMATGGYGRQ